MLKVFHISSLTILSLIYLVSAHAWDIREFKPDAPEVRAMERAHFHASVATPNILKKGESTAGIASVGPMIVLIRITNLPKNYINLRLAKTPSSEEREELSTQLSPGDY